MRVSRLYVESPLQPGASLTLPPESSHYLATVLRHSAGDAVLLFNGRDGEFLAHIDQANKKKVRVLVAEQQRTMEIPPLHVHLGVGLSRGERMDYVIQKAAELGVAAITPLYCKFGEVRFKQQSRLENKLRHWRQVLINACEQSGRLTIPDLFAPVSVEQWIPGQQTDSKLVLHTDAQGASRLSELELTKNIALLSGPEGGFSASEIETAKSAGFHTVVMGPRILRTETAPLAALAILQSLLGDF